MSSPSVSSFATSKRTACDRCRHMKLRCPERDERMRPSQCARCSRAGTECTFSFNRPLGRQMRLNIPEIMLQDNRQPDNSRYSGLDLPVSSAATGRLGSISSVASSAQGTTEEGRQQHAMELLTFPDDMCSFSVPTDTSTLSLEGSDLDYAADTAFWLACSQTDSTLAFDSPKLGYALENGQTPLEFQGDNTRLAALNHELSQQLDAWNRRLKQVGCNNNDMPQSPNHQSDSPGSEHSSSNPPSDALQAMARLVAIGQGYSSKPSIVVILNFFTAYLQTTALCNHIFTWLRRLLQDSSSSEPRSQPLQALPGLQIAGVTIEKIDLQARVLVDGMLHYVHLLEKILSLPPQLCVHEQQAAPEGWLRNEQHQFLIKSILNNTYLEREGFYSLTSLRSNIMRVREELGI